MPHGHSKSVEVRPIAVPYLQQTIVCFFPLDTTPRAEGVSESAQLGNEVESESVLGHLRTC
jgi:hypothetical protein